MSRAFAGYHYDIIAAKNGDAAARDRVARQASLDPEAHARALDEIAIELRERWSRMTKSDREHERSLWATLSQDDLLRIDV
jgi:hypothetical protein